MPEVFPPTPAREEKEVPEVLESRDPEVVATVMLDEALRGEVGSVVGRARVGRAGRGGVEEKWKGEEEDAGEGTPPTTVPPPAAAAEVSPSKSFAAELLLRLSPSLAALLEGETPPRLLLPPFPAFPPNPSSRRKASQVSFSPPVPPPAPPLSAAS